MRIFENNAYFWQKIDTLNLSSQLVVKKEKGDSHHKHKELIYPLKLCSLEIDNQDYNQLLAYVGSGGNEINAMVISTDILDKKIEVRLLIGVTLEEEEELMRFLDQTEFQKSILVRRENVIPYWLED